MTTLDRLTICAQHADRLRFWFAEDVDVAASQVIRLWIERNLRWYWLMNDLSAAPDPFDENAAMDWLAGNCAKVADGCPVCHDVNPNGLLARAAEAARRTLIESYPYWTVGSNVKRIFGANPGATIYLSTTAAEPMSLDAGARKHAPESWWN